MLAAPPDWTGLGRQEWSGLYLQDQIRIGEHPHMLVGGRYDRAHARAGSITLEYADPGSKLADVATTEATDHRFSPRLGALYQLTPAPSAYANHVESLGTWGTGLGIATDAAGHPLPAPARPRSRGLQRDVSGELTTDHSLIASYASTDAVFTEDSSGLRGHRIANVPRRSGSLWARFQLIPARMWAGAGVFARSERQGDNENTFQMPDYATVDAFASYATHISGTRVTAQLNVSNLFDRRYFINSNVYDASPRYGVMPGRPRTVLGALKIEL